MRVRTYLRRHRLALGMSIGDVSAATGLAKGEISAFERGRWVPRDDQTVALSLVYGPLEGWYPATVLRALLPDLADCPGCGDELDPDASGARRYHGHECQSAARRVAIRPQSVR